jgi:anti-anti-sigma regulatory factor
VSSGEGSSSSGHPVIFVNLKRTPSPRCAEAAHLVNLLAKLQRKGGTCSPVSVNGKLRIANRPQRLQIGRRSEDIREIR